jgi:serine/threonine protein kinase
VEIRGTDVVIGVLICILVIAALVGAATKYRNHQRSNAPTDFQTKLQEFNAKLETLKGQGLVDPEQTAKERVPRELRREWVTTIDRLGHGKFGEVWKGLLADAGNAMNVPEYLVAVKVALRPSGSEDTAAAAAAAEDELLNEALLMAQVESHRHLVSLVGVVTRGHPKMLVLSFCEHGELQGMLKRRAGNGEAFGMLTKHRFCAEIAAGMSVLASNHVVHRDLATRNVLLASGMVCKVGDFGMSRQVQSDDNTGDYYRRCDRTHTRTRTHTHTYTHMHAQTCSRIRASVKRLVLC